jgi:hypothetical protein
MSRSTRWTVCVYKVTGPQQGKEPKALKSAKCGKRERQTVETNAQVRTGRAPGISRVLGPLQPADWTVPSRLRTAELTLNSSAFPRLRAASLGLGTWGFGAIGVERSTPSVSGNPVR